MDVFTNWHSSWVYLLSSEQWKNLPLKSCTAITAKINWNKMYTMRMLMTFFKLFTTQSNTALSFGTRLIVFRGLSTLSTRSDFIVDRFCPADKPAMSNANDTAAQITTTASITFQNSRRYDPGCNITPRSMILKIISSVKTPVNA